MQTNLESGNLNRQALVLPFTCSLLEQRVPHQRIALPQPSTALWKAHWEVRRGQGLESVVWVTLGLCAIGVLIASLCS